MLKAEQVPDQVVEALQRYLSGCDCDECIAGSIAATLNAWPGVVKNYSWDASHGRIILPLPQEGE